MIGQVKHKIDYKHLKTFLTRILEIVFQSSQFFVILYTKQLID